MNYRRPYCFERLIEKNLKKLSATNLNFECTIQLREEILKLQEELPKD